MMKMASRSESMRGILSRKDSFFNFICLVPSNVLDSRPSKTFSWIRPSKSCVFTLGPLCFIHEESQARHPRLMSIPINTTFEPHKLLWLSLLSGKVLSETKIVSFLQTPGLKRWTWTRSLFMTLFKGKGRFCFIPIEKALWLVEMTKTEGLPIVVMVLY